MQAPGLLLSPVVGPDMGQGLAAQSMFRFGPGSGDACQTFRAFCGPFFLCKGKAVRSCVYLLIVTQKIAVTDL